MTRQIYAGPVAIGGGAPVSIQSMLNTRTTDVEGSLRQIRQNAHIGTHWLEILRGSTADVCRQCSHHGFPRENQRRLALQLSCQILSGKNAACRRFHIALHTGHLSGKGNAGFLFQPVIPVQQPRGIQKCIAVHHTVAQKFRVMQIRFLHFHIIVPPLSMPCPLHALLGRTCVFSAWDGAKSRSRSPPPCPCAPQ